jgi:hypothetical protein
MSGMNIRSDEQFILTDNVELRTFDSVIIKRYVRTSAQSLTLEKKQFGKDFCFCLPLGADLARSL